MILDTTPAPTVRPPSRIAKRKPSSIDKLQQTLSWPVTISTPSGSSTAPQTNFKLSPGITISTPSGSSTAPVISVVRK